MARYNKTRVIETIKIEDYENSIDQHQKIIDFYERNKGLYIQYDFEYDDGNPYIVGIIAYESYMESDLEYRNRLIAQEKSAQYQIDSIKKQLKELEDESENKD